MARIETKTAAVGDVCSVCLGVIAPGERIADDPGLPVRHAACPAAAARYTEAGRHYHIGAAERAALLVAARDAETDAAAGGLGPVMIAARVRALDACYGFQDADVARRQVVAACARRSLDAVRDRAVASIRS